MQNPRTGVPSRPDTGTRTGSPYLRGHGRGRCGVFDSPGGFGICRRCASQRATSVGQLRRLVVSCLWSRERFTLDAGMPGAVREALVSLYEAGLISRGDRLINWCVQCQTALSDLEVDHREQAGTLYHIRYGPVTVATVRPESKLGDTALAVHPDDARYRHLVGQTLAVDTESGTLELPVIADAAVDPAFGTGVVKVTPAHDPADWEVGQRHGLALRSGVGTDGRMTAEAGRD